MYDIDDDGIFYSSYTINEDGSKFHHCTPDCLGSLNNRILALDYSKMRITGIEVVYIWDTVDGQNVPCLILKLQTLDNKKDSKFSLICRLDDRREAIGSLDVMPLPNFNDFTPFTEDYCSMEITSYHTYMEEGNTTNYSYGSTIKMSKRNKTIEINCFRLEFVFED